MTGARLPNPACSRERAIRRDGGIDRGPWQVAEEALIALSCSRANLAVTAATPADLDDSAAGFSLTERIFTDPGQIEEAAIVAVPNGIELPLRLSLDRRAAAEVRWRHLAGPGGCGSCGVDGLEPAKRAPLHVTADSRFTTTDIAEALASLALAQTLNAATRATRAAGSSTCVEGLAAERKHVGRHSAVERPAGALAHAGHAGSGGFEIVTHAHWIIPAEEAACHVA